MPYTIEALPNLTTSALEEAAELTALGFGRRNDDHNFVDTKTHLTNADTVHFLRDEKQLVAFAAYRSLLWRLGN